MEQAATGVEQALDGVMLIHAHHAWATGVLISTGGLLLTNAHLLVTPPLPPPRPPTSYPPCTVRIPVRDPPPQGSAPHGGVHRHYHRWLPARVLHVFRNHLDLAVLQLEAPMWELSALGLRPLRLHPMGGDGPRCGRYPAGHARARMPAHGHACAGM